MSVPDGLMFCPRCFLYSTPDLRAPTADRRETSPNDGKLAEFYNAGPKIPGALPPEKSGGQNMRNFGQFCTTSDFDRECLRNKATRKDVRTRKIPPAFDEISPVNFGPLTAWNYTLVWTH